MATTAAELATAIEEIAPTNLAADWDNVGLLVEGPTKLSIERALLCIDLTHTVLNEAIEEGDFPEDLQEATACRQQRIFTTPLQKFRHSASTPKNT